MTLVRTRGSSGPPDLPSERPSLECGRLRPPGWSGPASLAGGALLIGFLAWPMLFTSSGLAQDWVGHLWEVWRQGSTLSHNHAPSLFVSAGNTVFLPLYGYYGGTLFTVSGALSLLLGGAVRAYVLMYLIGFAASYGGWYWLARMAGLGRWAAHVPGFVFVTSGYYLTEVYARGDFAEFSAVSELPLMVAAAISIMRAERLRVRPALALIGSTLIFFGSHNISLLWGLTLVVLLAVTIVVLVPQARRLLTRAGVFRVAAVAVPAALLNAWFLFPAIAYGSRTWVSTGYGLGLAHSLYATKPLVAAANLFAFSRAGASPDTPDFVLALPLLAIAWVLAGIVLSVRGSSGGAWRRVLLILAASTAVLAVVMTHPAIVLDLPRPYVLVQYTYRLETYVLLSICGALLATLVLLKGASARTRRIGSWALVVVIVASAAGAVEQVDTHPTTVHDRNLAFVTDSAPVRSHLLDQQLTYRDVTLAPIASAGLPAIAFPPASVRHDHVAVTVELAPGTRLVDTNLAGAPYFVTVRGAQVAGRDPHGFMVLKVPAGGGPRKISLLTASGLPLTLGRLVSFLALAYWLVFVMIVMLRRWSRPGGRGTAPSS